MQYLIDFINLLLLKLQINLLLGIPAVVYCIYFIRNQLYEVFHVLLFYQY